MFMRHSLLSVAPCSTLFVRWWARCLHQHCNIAAALPHSPPDLRTWRVVPARQRTDQEPHAFHASCLRTRSAGPYSKAGSKRAPKHNSDYNVRPSVHDRLCHPSYVPSARICLITRPRTQRQQVGHLQRLLSVCLALPDGCCVLHHLLHGGGRLCPLGMLQYVMPLCLHIVC